MQTSLLALCSLILSCTGIKAVLDKHKEAKLSVHFRADISGLLIPESADASAEVTEEYEVQVPVKDSKAEAKAEASAAEVCPGLSKSPCTSQA